MQFGIFDQNDRGPYSLSEQYGKRLALIEFYDRAGFRTCHMSEHHSTPLNLTPSPTYSSQLQPGARAHRPLHRQFSFGDLTQEEVLHAAGIFAREVLPPTRKSVAQLV